jgi:hypothetical protein
MGRRNKSLILGSNEKAVLDRLQFIQGSQPWIYEKHIGPVIILTYWNSIAGQWAIVLTNQGEEFCQRRFNIEDFEDAMQNAIQAVREVLQGDALWDLEQFRIGEPEEGDIEVLWDEA